MSDIDRDFGKPESYSERQRMNFSDALLSKPFESGDAALDKVFCLGKVSKEGHVWTVSVDSGSPTVALNQKVKEQLALADSPTVADVRARAVYPELSLISGGSFVWLHDHKGERLVCLRRDEAAPVDAGYLTCPAGRSGEPLTQTIVGETNEELIIIKTLRDGQERFKLLGFFRDENTKDKIVQQRLAQVKRIHDNLKQRGRESDAELLLKIRGEDDVEMLQIEGYLDSNPNGEEVVTLVRSREIDRVQNSIVLFDKANNTLEVNQALRVRLPEDAEIQTVIDGEVFGRKIEMFSSLSALTNEKLVPALQNYRNRLLAQDRET
ncbi:hypothetical protein HYW60_00900 [Candidatus Kaiserbacteria bacterium]|nr:hypothetical protein [Candidatus Kaiserbacteria bacterium]